jgi:hypothetical protein
MTAVRATQTVTLPPELLGEIPRDVELTPGGRATVAVAGALVVAAVISAVVMFVAYSRGEERKVLREREAVFTDAAVTKIAFVNTEEGRRPTVTYSYEVDGRSYVGRRRLRNSDRRLVAEGDTIAIGFLPSEPQTSWIEGYEERGFPIAVLPLVSGSLLLAAALVAATVRRQRVILSEGRATLARVVKHKKTTNSHGRSTGYRVTCEFKTLSGAPRSATYSTEKAPPAIGAIVPILYHRDNPKRTSGYPVPLVRTVRKVR